MRTQTLGRRFGWRILLVLVIFVVVYLVARQLPSVDLVLGFVEWVRHQGAWGTLAVGSIYVPVAVLMIPSTLLTLGSGFALGLWRGAIAVSLGSTLGAAVAFLIGRTLGRHWVERTLAQQPRFRSLDRAVARDGFKIILLLRLSPFFPYNVMNYVLGLSQVSFGRYVLATWLGLLPTSLFYVYVGSAAQNLASLASGEGEAPPGQSAMFAVGLVTAGIATFLVTRIAHRALKADVPAIDTPG